MKDTYGYVKDTYGYVLAGLVYWGMHGLDGPDRVFWVDFSVWACMAGGVIGLLLWLIQRLPDGLLVTLLLPLAISKSASYWPTFHSLPVDAVAMSIAAFVLCRAAEMVLLSWDGPPRSAAQSATSASSSESAG